MKRFEQVIRFAGYDGKRIDHFNCSLVFPLRISRDRDR
jgi:hypothetical protein